MTLRKQFKKLIIITSIAFTMLTFVVPALAYWDSSTEGFFMVSNQVTITIGDWVKVQSWKSNTRYKKGDKVTHNGKTYEARRPSKNREPGYGWLSWYFWTEL